MLRIGSNTWARSLLNVLKWVMLFGIPLIILLFLRKKTIMNKGSEVLQALQLTGLNETLCKFALAQSGHETAGFSSAIYRNNNNCFGMKYAGQVNASGEKNGYAYYATIYSSVADFVAWYTRHRASIFSLPLYINSLDSYVRFLKNNDYFEAAENEYLDGCTYFYNQYFG
jgi:hypothetical protein